MRNAASAGGHVSAVRRSALVTLELSLAAGAGLVCFEAAELAWLGFQPLKAVFAVVGVMVIGLAWPLPGTQGNTTGTRGG